MLCIVVMIHLQVRNNMNPIKKPMKKLTNKERIIFNYIKKSLSQDIQPRLIDIAEYTGKTKPNAQYFVDQLIKKDYLERINKLIIKEHEKGGKHKTNRSTERDVANTPHEPHEPHGGKNTKDDGSNRSTHSFGFRKSN